MTRKYFAFCAKSYIGYSDDKIQKMYEGKDIR